MGKRRSPWSPERRRRSARTVPAPRLTRWLPWCECARPPRSRRTGARARCRRRRRSVHRQRWRPDVSSEAITSDVQLSASVYCKDCATVTTSGAAIDPVRDVVRHVICSGGHWESGGTVVVGITAAVSPKRSATTAPTRAINASLCTSWARGYPGRRCRRYAGGTRTTVPDRHRSGDVGAGSHRRFRWGRRRTPRPARQAQCPRCRDVPRHRRGCRRPGRRLLRARSSSREKVPRSAQASTSPASSPETQASISWAAVTSPRS